MIGVDTNILIRYIMQDDEVQASLANRLIGSATPSNRIYLSALVTIETIWVLKSVYKVSLDKIADVIARLAASSKVKMQDAEVFRVIAESGFDADYMDSLITQAAKTAKCEHFYTFDEKLAKKEAYPELLHGDAPDGLLQLSPTDRRR
jgi:predicted nucleic-acid-binding protein